MGILSRAQIKEMGFAHVGKDTRLSDKASYYGCSRIRIGDNTRIDDFCILSAGEGGIEIGNYVHISAYTSFLGAGRMMVGDFCSISARVCIFGSNDDYSGKALCNPTIPSQFTNVTHSEVTIERHVIVGAGTVILPGIRLAEGVSIGALSLVKNDCAPFTIHAGSPSRYIADRKKDLLTLEAEFLSSVELEGSN